LQTCRPVKGLSDITAVIIAGGLGTRLRSVVSDRPKVLVDICERPFLTFLLDQLVAAKVRKVVLCTGYMADKIDEAFGNKYKSLKMIHSREFEPLGTGGALRLALPYFKTDSILVMNGDSFADVDLATYTKWFFKKDRQASLLLVKVPDTTRYGKVIANEDGRISAFEEKGLDAGPGLVNAGIYIMKTSLVASMVDDTPLSLENEFFPSLIDNEFYGFFYDGVFIDIGTPRSYHRAQAFFSKKTFREMNQ